MYLKTALIALAALSIAPAQAVKLYKWVDEDGSTHYHQTPPPKGTQFVEEKEFDGELNVVPSPATEAEMERERQSADSRQPDAEKSPGDENGQEDQSADSKPLTPEELTAIAEQEGASNPELPIETPGAGADPAGGSQTATGSAGASGGAGGAGAGTAAGAAPAVVPPIVPPAVVPGP